MRTAVLGALLVSVLAGCGSSAGQETAPQQQQDDLDSLDVANSWTDAANPKNPDLAGPIWWAWNMRLRGPKSELRALVNGRPREPVGVFSGDGFAETGAFSLTPGSYGLLVQYRENQAVDEGTLLGSVLVSQFPDGTWSREDIALGDLTVSSDTPVGAGGWRRAYLKFHFESTTHVVRRIHIENHANVNWQFGLVAIHREDRPFYGIAHNPDSVDRLRQAVAAGANALEPDLRHTKNDPGIAADEDGNVAVTEEGILGGASTANGQATLGSYLRELAAIAPRKLVIWDTKPGDTSDYAGVAESVKRASQREGYDLSKSVFNVSNATMTGLYGPFADNPAIGRCFDGIFTQVHSHTEAEWMGPVRANHLTFQGLGVTPQLQVTEKWSVPISVYVRAREQEDDLKKIYFWTVNDGVAMRRILDLGIDGLITDEIPLLRSILQEEPYASMYRYATDDDDHLAKHGGSFYWIESSEDLEGR